MAVVISDVTLNIQEDEFALQVLESSSSPEEILEAIQRILPFDRFDFLNREDEEQNTIIHHLCKCEPESVNLVTLQHILNYGGDPCHKNNLGETPLHYACDKNNKNVADVLIQFGAGIKEKNSENRTPPAKLQDGFERKAMEKFCNRSHQKFLKKNQKLKLAVYPEASVRAGFKASFDCVDIENNGSLNIQEMQNILFSLVNQEPSLEESEEFFNEIDANSDGEVTWEEFFTFMMKYFHDNSKPVSKSKKSLRKKKKKFGKKKRSRR